MSHSIDWKIVVIDDEEDVVKFIAAILTDNGYDVHTSMDGHEGFALVKKIKPDLICLDILMPGETGLSLFKKISTDTDLMDIPVIIISGMNYEDDLAASQKKPGAERSPAAYIEKPLKPLQFIDTVKNVIG